MQNQHRKVTALSILFCLLYFFACEKPEKTPADFVVKVRLPVEPDKLSPLLTLNGYASQVQENIFMSLEQFDPETLSLRPYLISKTPNYEAISSGEFQGGVAYTYELLEEAKWDNGQVVLASDYVFTIKAMLNPFVNAAPYRSYFDFLGDIKIDEQNPKRFTILTNRPYMLAKAALSSIPIYPEYHYDPEGLLQNFSISDFKKNELTKEQEIVLDTFAKHFHNSYFTATPDGIVGCGPYRILEWQTGNQIILKKKKNWWGNASSKNQRALASHPEEIKYKIIPDNAAAITALKDEQLDVLSEINPLSFSELKQNKHAVEKFNLYSPTEISYYYIALNAQKPALEDVHVRRALAALVDIDQITRNLLFNLGKRVIGPIHPSKSFYNHNLVEVPYDLAKARNLLQEAGWSDSDNDGILDKMISGKRELLDLDFIYSSSNKMGEGLGVILKDAAKKAGIKINLRGLPFKEAVKTYRARDYDLSFAKWSNLPGPDDLKQIWHTSSDTPMGGNRTGFGDKHSDVLIDSIRITLDEEKRKDLYLRIQKRIYDDQPYIFLFAPLERIAINKRFKANSSAQRPGFFPRQFTLITQQ